MAAVTARFSLDVDVTARVWTPARAHAAGGATLFRAGPRHVHIVGEGRTADELRAALTAGAAPGWRLYPMPETHTPLHLLRPRLSTRDYRLLAREGFLTVEDIAVTPDECLLDLRGAGPKFLAAVRAAVAACTGAAIGVAHRSDPDGVAARRAQLAEPLRPEQQLRYREFLDTLAVSRLPESALKAIADALNAEPVPLADPGVITLLETAEEHDLLDHYTRTHRA